jgi:hypothetical protein
MVLPRLAFVAAALFTTLLVASCTGRPMASDVPASPSFPSPSASPTSASPPPASPAPDSPAPTLAAASAPTTIAVSFRGLPEGTYPVHVHAICSGRQNFHITVVQSLGVGSGGAGTIGVPSSYFGRGLCLIVYTSPSLSAVLTTRRI